jgi:hypothetical protein
MWRVIRAYTREFTVGYILGRTYYFVTRALSLVLALAGLVLGVLFVAFLPAQGRLSLGDGLTLFGLLLTSASFFANAGKPSGGPGEAGRIIYVERAPTDAS